MPMCQRCQRLTIDELVENDVLLHPNLGALKTSATEGCDFCKLCWTALQTASKTQLDKLLQGKSAWEEGKSWTPTIWLRGTHFWDSGTAGTRIDVSCGKLRTTAGGFDHERDPEENPSPGVGDWLEVYEVPGKPSKYKLRGRRTTFDRDPDLYIPLIKQWVDDCRKTHKACYASSDKEMPTRVIDVSFKPDRVRLITTGPMHEPYIALSYCWGADTSGIFTLTKQTYPVMTDGAGLPVGKLAKTHCEVVALVRSLGIRYLWIDALCIIQGDAADWEKESVTMARVYGNAALTVIAGRSASTKDGFITNHLGKDKSRPPPCQLPVDGTPISGTLTIDLRRSEAMGPVFGRGWCFQERMISHRAIVFGEEQIFYSCSGGYYFENGQTRPNTLRPKFLQQPEPLPLAPRQIPAATGKAPTLTATEEILKAWYTVLTNFTTCALSNPHDVFAAVMAVAQQASKALPPGTRYLAGIWECDMVRGLLWRPCYHFQNGPMSHTLTTRPKSTFLTKEKGNVVRAPSWSWAAVEGPVAHVMFTPLLVSRYRDEKGWWMIRPKHAADSGAAKTGQNTVDRMKGLSLNQGHRWSADTRQVGVNELYMPACELHLVGRVARVKVFEEPVASYLTGRKWTKLSVAKAKSNGVLLSREGEPALKGADKWDHIVAIGFFDVREDRKGVKNVWCLPVARDMGLVLERRVDGKFARLGWFVVEREAWFVALKENDICLC
ncbi:Heterokaryon incompatibility protein (HET) domain containing protein [Naviculisporaceae sp. PSN 640]